MRKILIEMLMLFLLTCLMCQNTNYASPATKEEGIADIDRYVGLFASKNALFSLNSLDYISYFGEQAIPALIRGLRHSSPNVRGFSAVALSRFSNKEAILPLIELLNDVSIVELQVLSDDGERIHSSYGEPVYTVCEKAGRTLSTITGQNFGEINPKKVNELKFVSERWQDWWKKEKVAWVPSIIPTISNIPSDYAMYPIPEYARFLAGVKICLDPGHGGDSDKIGFKRGPSGNRESESNLRLCRYLRDFLVSCGAKVFMTRDSDKFVSLSDRPAIAQQTNSDVFLSIHHNWSFRYTAQATTIWYHDSPDYSPASMDIARFVFDEFTRLIHMRELDRTMGLKSDYLIYDQTGFAVLRDLSPEIPGVLCELAYFSNLETELKMRDSDFLKKEAYSVFLGLAKYFYAGVPRWYVQSVHNEHGKSSILQQKENNIIVSKSKELKLSIKIYDGLEDRKEWGCHWTRIFAQHLLVQLNDQNITYQYQDRTGILTCIVKDLPVGQHHIRLWIMNLNKNSNKPVQLKLQVE